MCVHLLPLTITIESLEICYVFMATKSNFNENTQRDTRQTPQYVMHYKDDVTGTDNHYADQLKVLSSIISYIITCLFSNSNGILMLTQN